MAPRPVTAPPWANGAWSALLADGAVDTALSFWHQGLLLAPEFPSFALVAFTAAVEALSGARAFRSALRGIHAEPCPSCGNRAKAAQRFWATLTLAADEGELQDLQRVIDVYDSRSDVAHGAKMFGFETAWGPLYTHARQPVPGVHGGADDDPDVFLRRTLPTVRRVTARLLHRALGAAEAGGPAEAGSAGGTGATGGAETGATGGTGGSGLPGVTDGDGRE